MASRRLIIKVEALKYKIELKGFDVLITKKTGKIILHVSKSIGTRFEYKANHSMTEEGWKDKKKEVLSNYTQSAIDKHISSLLTTVKCIHKPSLWAKR